MLPRQIQCLEDFEKISPTQNMKKELLTYVTEEVMNLFEKNEECLGVHTAFAQVGYSFFEALFLLSGTHLLKTSFLSNKARRIITDLDKRIKNRGENLDNTEKKLNTTIDELDESLLMHQFKIDSEYFKKYFNQLNIVRA
jgi:hypothetical protein